MADEIIVSGIAVPVEGPIEIVPSPATIDDVPNLDLTPSTPTSDPGPFNIEIDLTPATAPRLFSDDDIAKYLSNRTHDDLKAIPAYNAQIQRAAAKIQAENNRTQTEYASFAQWDQWFQQLNPGQFRYAMQDPEYAQNYSRVVEWLANGAPTGLMAKQQVAEEMLGHLQDYLGGHEDLQDLAENWDELLQERDFGKFVEKVISHGVEKRSTGHRKNLEVEARAQVAKILAQYHIAIPDPPSGSAIPANVGGQTAGWTKDRYERATIEEVASLSPAQIDAILR